MGEREGLQHLWMPKRLQTAHSGRNQRMVRLTGRCVPSHFALTSVGRLSTEKANAAKEKRLLRFQVVFAVRRVRGSPHLILIFFQCLDEAVKAGRMTVAPRQRDKWIAAVIKARDKVVKVNALDSRSEP